jgi:hypothetical protein
LYLPGIGYIAGDRQAVATSCFNLGNQWLEISVSAGGHRHICPCPSKSQCDATTYASTGACHHCSSSCERQVVLG